MVAQDTAYRSNGLCCQGYECGMPTGQALVLVSTMHVVASVYINDDEGGLLSDYEEWLEELAPYAPTSKHLHTRTREDNADAHLKRQIMGHEVVVAVTNGRLDFGTWERLFYGEFDGRPRKRVLVKNIDELRDLLAS